MLFIIFHVQRWSRCMYVYVWMCCGYLERTFSMQKWLLSWVKQHINFVGEFNAADLNHVHFVQNTLMAGRWSTIKFHYTSAHYIFIPCSIQSAKRIACFRSIHSCSSLALLKPRECHVKNVAWQHINVSIILCFVWIHLSVWKESKWTIARKWIWPVHFEESVTLLLEG